MPKIVTTLQLPPAALALFEGFAEVVGPDGWEGQVGDADALIALLTTRVDEELLQRAPSLRIVANAVVGVDNVDLSACRERGVTVTNTPDVLTDTTADLALALILVTVRRLSSAEDSLRAGEFHGWRFWDYLGGDLAGATLGIFGMGRIGQAVARRARAFGMRIIYTNRSPVQAAIEQELAATPVSLDELLETSDVLSLHAPLTPDTRHILNADALRRMKSGSILINTARGPLVDESALAEALRAGHLAGAGLDVYEKEPIVNPGLLDLPNVVLLPHVGSATVQTRTRMAMLAARNVRAVLSGEPALTPLR
ncbi:MAG: D-glycerate dehydrogenase [Gemmatimonadetes bacterium]|nr:D-glycerate dehydrogenase [Gemmatimonadota bacterium]